MSGIGLIAGKGFNALSIGQIARAISAGGGGGGAVVTNTSLRNRAGANPTISKVIGPSNATTWTYSLWTRIIPGNTHRLLCAGSSAQPYTLVGIQTDGILYIDHVVGGTPLARKYTTASFSAIDHSAYYHLQFVWDTANATAADRLRIYVNSVRITSFVLSVDPTANLQSYINNGGTHYIGSYFTAGYDDGEFAEVNFVDGLALEPSSFGTTDANGEWQPKVYNGSYGANGFRLQFNNGASLATLGADSSGNNNNWTLANYAVSAGPNRDNLSIGPGATYAKLNSYYIGGGSLLDTGWALAGAGITGQRQATLAMTNGKYYFECYGEWNPPEQQFRVGIGDTFDSPTNLPGANGRSYVAYIAGANTLYTLNGNNSVNTGIVVSGSPSIIMVAFDADTGNLWLGVNGTWANGGNPATGLNPTFVADSVATFKYVPTFCASVGATTNNIKPNFGQRPFDYTPPAGFNHLNTDNINTTPFASSGYGFVGNGSTSGPFIFTNCVPTNLFINGNAVVWGTHAIRTSTGFKVITSSASYNNVGANTFTYTPGTPTKYARGQLLG